MFQETVSDRLGAIRGVGVDDILAALGLERRRTFSSSIVPIASGFAAGALMGAGIALLFAPKAGREIREDIRKRADEVTRKVSEAAEGAVTDVRNALPQGFGGEDRLRSARPHEALSAERRPEPTNAGHSPSPMK